MSMKMITQNKKAYFDYQVLDKFEAGVVLTGDEVKSLRAGNVNLTGAFATARNGELFLLNCHISPYEKAYNKVEEDSKKTRKLLAKRREINRLIGDISRKGITLVPLSLYFNERGRVKVSIGLCKHRNAVSKKNMLKERDIKRETSREMKDYN